MGWKVNEKSTENERDAKADKAAEEERGGGGGGGAKEKRTGEVGRKIEERSLGKYVNQILCVVG